MKKPNLAEARHPLAFEIEDAGLERRMLRGRWAPTRVRRRDMRPPTPRALSNTRGEQPDCESKDAAARPDIPAPKTMMG